MPLSEVNPAQDGRVDKPLNREPSMDVLVSSFITTDENYDRNHGSVQHISGTQHVLTVDGIVSQPLQVTVAQLVANYPQHKITAALQCAGNRRHTMRTQLKEVSGVDWFDAAIMNCTWEGPRLRDVLTSAGLAFPNDMMTKHSRGPHPGNGASGVHEHSEENRMRYSGNNGVTHAADSSLDHAVYLSSSDNAANNLHVQFASYGSKTQDDDWYGGSIPLERALDPEMDVILAVKMNGQPLPARHGFPVRAIVPGVLGARSVKWLDRITVSTEESSNFYQRHDYKILPPDVPSMEAAKRVWEQIPAMEDMPINACISYPVYESTFRLNHNGKVNVKGYAVPQGSDGPVIRVEVSGDEGRTWVDAEIYYGPEELRSKWSWVLWTAEIEIARGENRKIYAKASDRGGNVQNEARSTWNVRGVGYNGFEASYGLTVL